MLGTVTTTTAILGILSFFGISNVSQLKQLLLNVVGKKDQQVDVVVDGEDVEITKNGKLLVRFNVDAIEEILNKKEPQDG